MLDTVKKDVDANFNEQDKHLWLTFRHKTAEEEMQQNQSAFLTVGWCISPELLKHLVDIGEKDAYIMIVALTEDGRELRQFEELGKYSTTFKFDTDGKHYIHAAIITKEGYWRSSKDVAKKLSYPDYRVFEYDPEAKSEDKVFGPDFKLVGYTKTVVTVPENAFAVLSPWETKIQDMWPGTDLKDTCMQRARRIMYPFAAIFLAIVYTLTFTIHLITALIFGIFLASREVNWRYLLCDPLDYTSTEIRGYFDPGEIGTLLSKDSNGRNRLSSYNDALRFLSPLGIILISFITILIGALINVGFLLALVIVTAVVIVTVFIINIIEQHNNKQTAYEHSDAGKKEKEEQKKAEAISAYSNLVCELGERKTLTEIPWSVSSAPRKIYQELKPRVCRPFARKKHM